MDDYIALAKVDDFATISVRSFSVFGKKIGIIKREDGSFYARDVACKHQGADLTAGEIDGNIATCHRHQWKYNLETGECLNHDSLPLKKYPLKIEDGIIKITLTEEI